MACDSCWAHNQIQTTSLVKIRRLTSGALYGGAGDGDDRSLIAMLDKVRVPERLPPREDLADLQGDFEALIVLPSGLIFHLSKEKDEAQIWQSNRKIAAVGSGGELAIGAMASGKTAREAVAIACDWDVNSRLPAHTLELKRTRK